MGDRVHPPGIGFTFFSAATEAWLVDALHSTGYDGPLESVFARAQVVAGAAMLIGTVSGGFVAQQTSLAVPYFIRAGLLGVTLIVAWRFMHDLGFTRRPLEHVSKEVRSLLRDSFHTGFGNPHLRWLIISSFFITGVSIYGFYAMQPYLLEPYVTTRRSRSRLGPPSSPRQIVGGSVVPLFQKLFRRRTTAILVTTTTATIAIAMVSVGRSFWLVGAAFVLWAFAVSLTTPIRQAFMNGCIPSSQRATVLSLDALGRLGRRSGDPAHPR